MKKLGLCVRYDCNNYGSMLQILATQRAIEKMDWEYEIIRYNKKTPGFLIRNCTRLLNPYFMKGKIISCKKNILLKKHSDIQKSNAQRLNFFKEYRKKYIGPYSKVYKGYRSLVAGAKEYDAVMVGSDQLWTPAGVQSKFYNLLFVPDEVRKISLATSFGITKVPKNQVKVTKEYLDRIEFLSVRESSGAEIVKQISGRSATVAVDPTLFFSGREWEQIFPAQKICSEPYIFAYFLGTALEHRQVVTKLGQDTGLKVITCPHMDEFVNADLTFGDKKRFDVDPVIFLNLIRGADYICTDSFHGSIFSILNHKKFLVFNRYSDELRKSKNCRISNLLALLGIRERHCVDGTTDLKDMIQQEINYSNVDTVLEELRKSSFDFLNKALAK